MITGASNMDGAVIVVAASDGQMFVNDLGMQRQRFNRAVGLKQGSIFS